MTRSVVAALGIATGAGAPVQPVESFELDEDGAVGDRYREGMGHWEGRGTEPVTLVWADDVAEAARELGVALDPLAMRRNVVVRGGRAADWIGRRFRLGGAELEGVRPCAPCAYLEGLLDLPGLKDALRDRGGVRARVLRGGRVRVGDALEGIILQV